MYKLSSYVMFVLLVVPPCLLFVVNFYGNTVNVSFDQKHLFEGLKPVHNFLSDLVQYKEVTTEPVKYKYILSWCEAYGGKTYGWSFGSWPK